MARSFFWRRRISGWFKATFFCVSAIFVWSLMVIVRHLQAGTMFPKEAAYILVGSLFVAAYLLPRFVGLVRNRMRITFDETGLELSSGRRIASERLKDLNLDSQSHVPVTVQVVQWPIPTRIYLSCYEDSEDLFRCLQEFGHQ